MKYIRISQESGVEVVESEFMPLFKPLQPLEESIYRLFSDRQTAIIFGENGQIFIFGLRNNVEGVGLTGLSEEQATIVRTELKMSTDTTT
jgi:hypothetical protein